MPLGAGPLPVLFLLVARRHVVADRVSQDVLRGAGGGNVLAGSADDDAELALEVHRVGVGRQRNGHVRADDRGVGLHEHHRVGEISPAHLGDVGRVVLPDAHHLAGQDGREQPHVGQRPIPSSEGRCAEGVLGDFSDDRLSRVIGGTLDADEGDPVGAGDTSKAHSLSLVAAILGAAAPPAAAASQIMRSKVQIYETAMQILADARRDDQHRAALVDARHRTDRDDERQRVHQRCGVPHSEPAARPRTRPRGRGPAVIAAQLRPGAHAHRVGLHRRPRRRTHRVDSRVGAHRRGRVRGRIRRLIVRHRCIPASRWDGGRKQQFSQRPVGGRLVPAGSTRVGHGYPPNRDTARGRLGRLGDSESRRVLQHLGGPLVPGDCVRRFRGHLRGGRDRSATAATLRGPGRAPRESLPGIDRC